MPESFSRNDPALPVARASATFSWTPTLPFPDHGRGPWKSQPVHPGGILAE